MNYEITLAHKGDKLDAVPVTKVHGFGFYHISESDIGNKRKKVRALCFHTKEHLDALERYIELQRKVLKIKPSKELEK